MILPETTNASISTQVSNYGYTYVRQIGTGGYSNVHLVFSEKYQQYFVIKENIMSSKEELMNEFELLQSFDHPNIVYIYSLLDIDSGNCIVLEYCSGGTLEDLIESNGRIRSPVIYNYCFQLLSAIEYLHQNKIVHQDIKPSNILLNHQGKIKLIDFGFSQQVHSNSQSRFCGTTLFMAPEILEKTEGFDPFLSDIYSLGITFYYISQGKFPFPKESQKDMKVLTMCGLCFFQHEIDTSFQAMITDMMDEKPEKRASASQLISHHLFQKSQINSSNSFSGNKIIKFRNFIHKRSSRHHFRNQEY
jgi:serine/threonine protein kinase